VWAEVPRKLKQLGSRGTIEATEAARLWWTRYCPLIRVVDTGHLPPSPAFRALAQRHPSDVPLANLVGLLAPVVVLAGDNDLIDAALSDGNWWIASKSGEMLSVLGVGAFSGTALTVGALREWQHRPLDAVNQILYIEALVIKVRTSGTVVNRTSYRAPGVDLEGRTQVLGIWLGDGGEGAKFWLAVLTELRAGGHRTSSSAATAGRS